MKIATLGPKGTFSEQAVRKYEGTLAKKNEIVFSKNIKEIFKIVDNGGVDVGVVPVENMIGGSVGETLDLLYHNEVYIVAEIIVPVHLCIASNSPIEKIKIALSYPKALSQCLGYIENKNLNTMEKESTAAAMKFVSESDEDTLAAIGPEIAANEYKLNILDKNIEDQKNNVTRFFVISKEKLSKKENKQYKTSMVLHPKVDKPGLLQSLLKPFSVDNINLTKIESRPTKINLGEYIFYVDLEGHEEDEKVGRALGEIKKLANVKVFGSYEKVF